MNIRASGVLMHITSLPGDYGIGSFGQAAYDFVDFLKETKPNILANFAMIYYKLWRFTLPIIVSNSGKYSLYRFGFPYS